MPRIEPALLPAVTDLERGLRELGVPFGFVGALVPELLLDTPPARRTNDADVTVVVGSLADFETLKDQLAGFGFDRTRLPHRMRHRSGGLVDLLPFSEFIAPDGRLRLQEGFVLNVAGLAHVVPHAVATAIDDGPTVPVAPLPLYALLKLVAYSDRREPRDLAGVFHCLRHYLERQSGVLPRHVAAAGSSGQVQEPGHYLDIYEDDQLDEAQLAAWVKQASRLPGERM